MPGIPWYCGDSVCQWLRLLGKVPEIDLQTLLQMNFCPSKRTSLFFLIISLAKYCQLQYVNSNKCVGHFQGGEWINKLQSLPWDESSWNHWAIDVQLATFHACFRFLHFLKWKHYNLYSTIIVGLYKDNKSDKTVFKSGHTMQLCLRKHSPPPRISPHMYQCISIPSIWLW